MKKICDLTAENVDLLSEEIATFLKKQKQTKDNILKARLSAESTLLVWQENMPEGTKVAINCFVSFGRPIIRLTMVGKKCNPTQSTNEVEDYFSKIQGNLAIANNFKYVNKLNVFDIKLPFSNFSTWQKNICAIVLAVLTWAIFYFISPEIGKFINTNFIIPTFKMILGLLKALASFMVFFNMLNAVCNMGDLSTLSKLGFGLIKYSEKTNLVTLLLIFGVGFFTFDVVDLNQSISVGALGEIYKIFLNIVPLSLIEPFVTGNTLQILFISMFGGILLLMLGQQTSTTIKCIGELNVLFMSAISRFSAVIPLIVYLSFTSLLLSDKFAVLLNMWKIPVVVYCVGLAWVFGHTVFAAVSSGFDLKKHFARVMPVSLLAYTTSSTMPCIPLMTKTLTEEGVEPNYRDFALPLSQILCSNGIAISMATVAMGLAEMAGIKLSLSTFIITMISVFLLAQTVPPVTGASISIMILILAQINVPQELIAPFISIDFFLNMMRTCAGKTSVMNNVFACAKKENKMAE